MADTADKRWLLPRQLIDCSHVYFLLNVCVRYKFVYSVGKLTKYHMLHSNNRLLTNIRKIASLYPLFVFLFFYASNLL